MDTYVTGAVIRQLREKRGMTQAELAAQLGVSSKTVSKWETAKGLPDISLLQPLAQTLNVSVMELMNGKHTANRNISGNLLRAKLYICPLCGNVIFGTGEAVISCCGILLPALEAEQADEGHRAVIEAVEDEQFITIDHPIAYPWLCFKNTEERLVAALKRTHFRNSKLYQLHKYLPERIPDLIQNQIRYFLFICRGDYQQKNIQLLLA